MKLEIGKQIVDLDNDFGYCEIEFGDALFVFAATKSKHISFIFQMDDTVWTEFLICKENEFDIQLFYNAFKKHCNEYMCFMNKFFDEKNNNFNVRRIV